MACCGLIVLVAGVVGLPRGPRSAGRHARQPALPNPSLLLAAAMRAAEIRGGQVLLLQHGAHRAIQHEDALAENFAKSEALLNQVLHIANSIFSWVQRNGAWRETEKCGSRTPVVTQNSKQRRKEIPP